MVDLEARLDTMETAELLEYQQQLTRERLAVLDAGRRAQDELDRRAADRAAQRAREDQQLGAVSKPPPQDVFGTKLTQVDDEEGQG